MLSYLQDNKPMGCILQCHEKISSNYTVNRPYTKTESYQIAIPRARVTEKQNFLLSQPSHLSM